MIVLDEQLLGRNIELEIAKWYQGAVRNIIELRPHTVTKMMLSLDCFVSRSNRSL